MGCSLGAAPSHVRARRRLRLLLALALGGLCFADDLQFPDAAALERFVLAPTDDGVKESLEAVLTVDGAGSMVSLAAKMGPSYATRVAGMLPDAGYREGYSDLAKYLDLFGPCQKKQAAGAGGWWSNYPDPPSERYCPEVAKLLFSALMRNQVHYCGRLASGIEKPKVPVASGKQPPYRLDEPPVQTHWLKAKAVYAMADAALRFGFAETLRRRAAEIGGSDDKIRGAMQAAADELDSENPSREQAGLALAKLLLRRYERAHLAHLERPERD